MIKKKFKAIELNKLDGKTIANIRVWRNQPFVREKMYTQNIITEEEHTNYIKSIKSDPNRGLFVFYLDDEPFGVFQYRINPENNCVTGGHYLIDEEYQFMGYGVIMSYFIGVIDFDVLKCRKNYGEIISKNKRLIAMNKKMNVTLEGILRDHVSIDGKYYDVYCYGCLRSEWEKDNKLKNMISKIVDDDYEILK